VLKLLLATSAALAASLAALAQQTPAALDCEFDQGISRSDGDRAAQSRNEPLSLRFTGIDVARGSATLVEGGASSTVAAMASGHVVTFVELMPSGNVSMTTVSALPTNGRRLAVYSKHLFGSVAPNYVAAQHYGSCVEGG
jgi:hypothetical protein